MSQTFLAFVLMIRGKRWGGGAGRLIERRNTDPTPYPRRHTNLTVA